MLIEVINRINIFNSHPIADIFRPNTLETNFGTLTYTDTGIKWNQKYISQDNADDFDTIAIERTHQKQFKHQLYKQYRHVR